MSQQPPPQNATPAEQPGGSAPGERRITLVPTQERRRLFDRRRKPLGVVIDERRTTDRRSVTSAAAGFTGVPFARSAKLDLDEFFDDGHQILDEVLANSSRHITIAYTRPSGSIAHGVNLSVGPAVTDHLDTPAIADDQLADPQFATDTTHDAGGTTALLDHDPAASSATATKDTTPVLANTNDLLPRGRMAPHPVTLLGNRAPAAGQTSVVPDPRRFIDFYSRKIGWVYEIDSPKWGFYSGWRPTLEWTKKAGKRMMNLIDSWGEPDDPDEYV